MTPLMTDQVARVSTKSVFVSPGDKERIVLVDFGAKAEFCVILPNAAAMLLLFLMMQLQMKFAALAPDGIHVVQWPWGSEGCASRC